MRAKSNGRCGSRARVVRSCTRFLLTIAVAALIAACDRAEPPPAPASTPTAASAGTAAPASTAAPTPAQPATPRSDATAAARTTVRVAVPGDDNLQFMTFWVARGAGLFTAEGLDVQIVVPPMPGAAGQFMVMGRADVALLAPPMYLNLVGQRQPILIFASLFQNDPINLVVRQDVAEERGLSADMPLRERLEAMRGLRVGVAAGPPTRLRVLFESVGLDADRDIEMVIVGGDAQNQAFADGEVDALYAHTPYLEKAIVEQGAVMIVNQSAGEGADHTNRHSLVTTRNYAAANPDVLVAVARAIHRAQQLIHRDLDATAEALRASGVRLLAPEGLETILAIYEPAIPATPAVSVGGVVRELELFPAQQTPPDLSGIDLADYVAPQFAEQAVASGS